MCLDQLDSELQRSASVSIVLRLVICADMPSFSHGCQGSEGKGFTIVHFTCSRTLPAGPSPAPLNYCLYCNLQRSLTKFSKITPFILKKNLQIHFNDFVLLWGPQRAMAMMRSFMMWLLAAFLPHQAPSSVLSIPSGHFPSSMSLTESSCFLPRGLYEGSFS